jgi:hypothetical protein
MGRGCCRERSTLTETARCQPQDARQTLNDQIAPLAELRNTI